MAIIKKPKISDMGPLDNEVKRPYTKSRGGESRQQANIDQKSRFNIFSLHVFNEFWIWKGMSNLQRKNYFLDKGKSGQGGGREREKESDRQHEQRSVFKGCTHKMSQRLGREILVTTPLIKIFEFPAWPFGGELPLRIPRATDINPYPSE